jgi:hypothetical protein
MGAIQASPMSLRFTLNLEGMAGSSVEQCGDEALRIAKQLGVLVVYSFNGVKCNVYPHGSTEKLVVNWEKAMSAKDPWVSNV